MKYSKLIIDGPYLAHRSHSAPYKLTTSKGLDSTMLHSFMRSLFSFQKKFKPTTTVVAWESHGTTSWRREQYPTYKPTQSIDTQYVMGVQDIQDLLYLLNIPQFNSAHNEADDVISVLSNSYNEPVVIFTKDKDIMQLITHDVHIYDGKKIITKQQVIEKFGVVPKQIPDYLAIMGDKSDNIEGVVGYGGKKTSKILMEYTSIESIPENLFDEETIKKIKNNKKLTTLNRKCILSKLPIQEPKTTIKTLLEKYELEKLKKDIEEYQQIDESEEENIFDFF